MEKIAIINIGTNELKVTFAGVKEGGYYCIFDQICDPVKLGEDLSKDGFLKSNRITEVLEILKGYKKLITSYGISDVTCVATNAIKKAKNQKSFIDEIISIVGFKIKILEEEEELKYIYTGVVNSLDVPKGVVFNIGGETTDLVIYVRRNILLLKVLPFGANTLADKFMGEANPAEKALAFMKAELAGIEELKNLEPEFQIVGTGNVFDAVSKISRMAKKYPFDRSHNYVMAPKDVNDVYNFVKTLDVDKSKKIRGISEDRADVIAVGTGMVKAIAESLTSESLIISQTGLTDGMLFNIADETTMEKPFTDILWHSLETQGKFYPDGERNCENVYNLAIILFKQLRVLHKLSRSFVKVLRVASYMHDSGARINFDGHTKNSYPVILNANIYGVSHREQILAAFVSASQDSVDFNLTEFAKYRDILSAEDLESVKKLAVIVRIAESLDRCGTGIVKDITCDILGDSVIIKAITDSDASFEIRDALSSASDFKRAYKKSLEIL